MTRIFEALRKAQTREAVDVTQVQPAVHPLRPAPRGPVERLEIAPLGAGAPLDEGTIREMAGLRVSLEGALRGPLPRTVMMVCAQAGDGTSTVAFQFAESLVREAGMRVLLVDANSRSRSPLIERARGASLPLGARGHGALDLLPLGDRMRQSGVMPQVEIQAILENAGAGYDWVVVDGPPLIDSPEAAPMAALLQGTVIVVRSGSTKRPVLVRALDLLRRAGANVLGTVLNRRQLEIPDFIYRRI